MSFLRDKVEDFRWELETATREIADVRRELDEGIYSKKEIGKFLDLGLTRLYFLYENMGGNRDELQASIEEEMKGRGFCVRVK